MTTDEVRAWLKATPFRPFRLIFRHGKQYDITHPNYVRVLPEDLHIFFGEDPLGPMDGVEYLSLEWIERVELLEPIDQVR
jgi:hypothetical protein